MIAIVESIISTNDVLNSVQDPAAGGINLFIGTTRNHSSGKNVLHLEYEAYQPMALLQMEAIAAHIKHSWQIKHLSIVHRIGRVEIGEASVVIAVSSVHRKEAFEACRHAIDVLKRDVPIWKKEFFADGSVWVGAQERRKD